MKRKLLISLLAISFFTSYGQSTSEIINKTVNEFCECAERAKDKRQFELCGRIFDPLNSVGLSKSDSSYILQRLRTECREAIDRLMKLPSDTSPKVVACSLLQAEDVVIYDLLKEINEGSSIKWKGNSPDQLIRRLFDLRETFSSESLAKEELEKKKQRTLSNIYKKAILENDVFQSIEIFHAELISDRHMYQVFARKGNLICFLSIGTSKEDMVLIQDLISKVSARVKKCK